MVQVASLFNQLLQHFPRLEFGSLVRRHEAEKGAKGFSCWTQFVAMLFCQLAHADSLREICNGLSCCQGKLIHLGVTRAPNKSTLSYANEHRPAKLFEDLFWTASQRFREQQGMGIRKTRFRFKNKLLSLDSTTFTLCLGLFPWARFRRAKGGVKAHVVLDHDDYMPAYMLLTEARCSDVKVAQQLVFNAGSIVVMDRGYNDYALFGKWTAQEVHFVTRMKENTAYEAVHECEIPQNRNILSPGDFTREALKAGAKLVVAIEVTPQSIECLRRNLAREVSEGRLIVYPKGVWDKENSLTLNIVDDNFAANSVVMKPEGSHRSVTVPLTTIDRIVAELKLPRVDFIKLDVEGAESRAITGARDILNRYKPRLAITTEHSVEARLLFHARFVKSAPITGCSADRAWKRTDGSEPTCFIFISRAASQKAKPTVTW